MNNPISMEDVLRARDEGSKKKGDPFQAQKLATAFLRESGHVYRYYNLRMLRYDGTRYLDDDHVALRLRQYLMNNGIPHNNNLIGNILPFIQAMTIEEGRELPFFAGDARPSDPSSTVTFRNGLLDIRRAIKGDHELIPHTENWVSMTCLPHDYDPGAECPRWLSFLDETLEGDPERIALLQEWAGYLLLPDASRQKMLALLGVSRGGKGTVATILQSMLGENNWTAYNFNSLENRFGTGPLVGKLAAFVGEVNLQLNMHKYAILANLNSIIGCDPVQVEYKHDRKILSQRLYTRFVIACNAFPNFSDASGALAERVCIINFRRAVPEGRRNPFLAAELGQEISGITNWAIEGLARLARQDRFTTPELSKVTTNKIRRNASPVVAFVQDRVKVSRFLDTGNLPNIEVVDEDLWVDKETLRDAYVTWAANCYEGDVSPNYLKRDLEILLPSIQEKKLQKEGAPRRMGFVGLALKPISQD